MGHVQPTACHDEVPSAANVPEPKVPQAQVSGLPGVVDLDCFFKMIFIVSFFSDRGFRRTTDYNPVMWSEYFAEQRDVQTGKGVFRVYLTKQPEETGPLLVMLHGGGFSALSWAHFSVEIAKIIHCQCLAIDIRGHGDTQTDNEDDLSAETLAQ